MKSEVSKTFKDDLGLKIRVEAGKNGWTIMYADSSSEYKDVEDMDDNCSNCGNNFIVYNYNI
jgi:hypothetical protein